MNDKEHLAIERIVTYCEKAETARITHFPTKEKYDEDAFYGDGIALYIGQIGESVKDLTDEFMLAHPEVPWHQIRGMRNIIAHAYDGVDSDVVWDVLTHDLPRLKESCLQILAQ